MKHGTNGAYTSGGCRCEDCKAAAKAYRSSRKEQIRTYQQAYRMENLERLKEYKAQWYQANRDDQLARERERYLSNPGQFADYQRMYRDTTRGRAVRRAANQRRRARKRGLDHGCVSASALESLWQSSNGQCAYCPAPAGTFDHVTPLAKGGLHCVENLTPACASCNSSKSAQSLDEWLAKRAPSPNPA